MREMLHIFITLNPKRILNFSKLMPLEAQYLSYLLNEDVCYTTIPPDLNLIVQNMMSKLFL